MKSGWYDLGGRLAKASADVKMPGCYVFNEFTGLLGWDPRVNVEEARAAGCELRELDEHEKRAMRGARIAGRRRADMSELWVPAHRPDTVRVSDR